MKLNMDLLNNTDLLREKGWITPEFDVLKMRENTKAAPEWAHFGPGNIFRAHIARAHQFLLNKGFARTGIMAFTAAGSETPAIAYAPFDNLCLSVSLKASGDMEKTLIASVAECHAMEGKGLDRAIEVFESPALKMATYTITEKGYARSSYEADMDKNPKDAKSVVGMTAYLLKRRMEKGLPPIALVSMDNCSKNGDKLKNAVLEVAQSWGDGALCSYINENSFPWTMIDKITPRPDPRVTEMLEKDGFENVAPVVTPRGTYIAPFVNAEEKEYLVIEDSFPAGRMPLEKAGMYFTTRDTVSKVERMKVTVCLNPLHTSLAIFGCLLGYDAIWKETHDEELSRLIRALGYEEGLPVAPDPVIFSPKQFLDEVVCDRLPNPYLPDTPQRIATDTSQKMTVRYGETLKSYIEKYGTAENMIAIPLTLAGYLRYIEGIQDNGTPFTPSADPRLDEVRARSPEENINDDTLWGVSLKKAGIADKVLALYNEMKVGSIRATIKKHV